MSLVTDQTDDDDKIHSVGNARYIRGICTLLDGNILPLFAHVTEIIMHGRPHAQYVFRSVPSFLVANFCEIPPPFK